MEALNLKVQELKKVFGDIRSRYLKAQNNLLESQRKLGLFEDALKVHILLGEKEKAEKIERRIATLKEEIVNLDREVSVLVRAEKDICTLPNSPVFQLAKSVQEEGLVLLDQLSGDLDAKIESLQQAKIAYLERLSDTGNTLREAGEVAVRVREMEKYLSSEHWVSLHQFKNPKLEYIAPTEKEMKSSLGRLPWWGKIYG